jgi:beta-glucuronidase
MAAPRLIALAAAAKLLAAPAAAQSGPWPSAEPHWPHYSSRKVTVLSGAWAFGATRSGVDAATVPYSAIDTPDVTTVPGAYDVAPPGVVPARGVAFFRSTHECSPGVPALIKFGAVNMYARVFADGLEVGNHTAGGYTPFELLLPPCGAGGAREIAVVNSNEQLAALSPTFTGGDFFFYSGIIRPVIVTELPCDANAWLRRVEALTVDAARGLLDVRVVLGAGLCPGGSALPPTVHLAVAFHGAAPDPASAKEYAVVDGVAVIPSVAVPAPWAPWTLGAGAGNASLVVVRVLETASGDSMSVRTGVREVAVDAASARITLNGQRVKLLGYNRHTMWPDSGAAVTPAQELADMQLLVALNANYIRGAHYPQAQSWLDLCDEYGIAVWEEALGPGTRTSNMVDPWFMQNQVAAVSSMVETSINHPSVFLHGFFNEGPSDDPLACVGYAASAAAVRARVGTSPPARLVTWANNHGAGDKCIAYEDVISFNAYPGWYDHGGDLPYVAPYWQGQIAWVAANYPEKAFTVSETGGGAVFEWVNASAPSTFWSQSYQANLVSADATTMGNSTRVSGLTLWQFSDIKVAQCAQCDYLPHGNLSTPWDCASVDVSCGRPKGENNKGAVDFWRREKLSFARISQIYAENAGN